jgi:hypothetical protein
MLHVTKKGEISGFFSVGICFLVGGHFYQKRCVERGFVTEAKYKDKF